MFLFRNIKKKMKKTLLKAYIWSVALYEGGTQTTSTNKIKNTSSVRDMTLQANAYENKLDRVQNK